MVHALRGRLQRGEQGTGQGRRGSTDDHDRKDVGVSYEALALWVYLGAMPFLFIPVVRYFTEGDKVENNDDLTMLCCFVLVSLLVWPIWFVGWMPVLGFAKSVKYVANYERKIVERSS